MTVLMEYLVKNNYLKNEERGMFEYGLKVFILNICSVLSILLVSCLQGEVIVGFVFIINFVLMRTNIGGFHCKSPICCLIIFPILYLSLRSIFSFFKLHFIIYILFVILLVINIINPIRNNKSIKENDVIRCRIKLKLYSFLIGFIMICFFKFSLPTPLIQGISLAIILAFLLYVFEYTRIVFWKNNRINDSKERVE